jgi:DNA-binding transcriptional LysR family regulator
MDIRQLRHLMAVAETGSFSRAAEQQHLTQSALSRSIQTLEGDIGGRLLDRVGKRNELTPLGHLVVQRAQRIVQEADDLRESARLMETGGMGALRVGMGSGPGALLMTPLLQHMAHHHPGVKVEISRGAPELQLVHLRERRLDALVVDGRRIAPAADLHIEFVAEIQAGFLCRKGHPLAGRRRVPFTELLAYPMASTPLSDEVARLLVDAYGPRADPVQMTTLICEELPSLIETVRETDAIYLGIRAAARQALASGALVELAVQPALKASARFAQVTLAGRTQGPAMDLLRKFVATHLKD